MTILESNVFVQIDLPHPKGQQRVWMDICHGYDQTAMFFWGNQWSSFEKPIPQFIRHWCQLLQAVFIDVGSGTGFYSLLALVSRASFVYAIEPLPPIAQVFLGNVTISELPLDFQQKTLAIGRESQIGMIYLSDKNDEHSLLKRPATLRSDLYPNSASSMDVEIECLDNLFHKKDLLKKPVILKMDIPGTEVHALQGALRFIETVRPMIVCFIYENNPFFHQFCQQFSYVFYDIKTKKYYADLPILASQNYLLAPQENIELWFGEL